LNDEMVHAPFNPIADCVSSPHACNRNPTREQHKPQYQRLYADAIWMPPRQCRGRVNTYFKKQRLEEVTQMIAVPM
jgi:hypothetical protein